MITADQLVLHAIGDYVLQSSWMAARKTSSFAVALVHALAYGLPFLLLTTSPAALAVIVGTHAVIDRWRLARFVVWAKDRLSPPTYVAVPGRPKPDGTPTPGELVREWWRPWSECSKTGYPPSTPDFLAFWLMVIADNLMHVGINAAALRWLA